MNRNRKTKRVSDTRYVTNKSICTYPYKVLRGNVSPSIQKRDNTKTKSKMNGVRRMRQRRATVSLAMIILILVMAIAAVLLSGCGNVIGTEAERVSYNVSQSAENFNVVRRLTVLNARTDKPMFELVGNFSIETDNVDNQLEVVCEVGKNQYKKHFVRLNEWTMYVVEDIGGAEVNKYRYEVNYLPEAIIPITFTSED